MLEMLDQLRRPSRCTSAAAGDRRGVPLVGDAARCGRSCAARRACTDRPCAAGTSPADELCVLDDAGVHVDQHTACRPARCESLTGRNSGSVDRTNSDFGYAFCSCVRPSRDDHLGAADDAPDRLVEEQIADEILRQPVARGRSRPRGRGEVIERAVRHAHPVHAALHVGDAAGRRPGHLEVRLEVVRDVERAVRDRAPGS